MTDREETKRLLDDSDDADDGDIHENVREDSSEKEVFIFEDAIKSTGYGKYHIYILLLCGWAVSSDAVEVLSVSFLLPSASCDLHMNSADKGWLSAIVFVGMLVGGYLWGSLADRTGRRSTLMWSLLLNGVGGLVSSTAQVFWFFLLMRFISGIGVGGSIPVIFSYFVEFQPKDRRGTMISVLATFWMGGNIMAAGLAWIVIPHKTLGYFHPDFIYNSWRIFVALCTIPSLTSAAAFVLMPESPKYLLTIGKHKEAIAVLSQVFHKNGGKGIFPVKYLVLSEDDKEEVTQHMDDRLHFSESPSPWYRCHIKNKCLSLLQRTFELFNPQLRRGSILLIIINFTLAFGYYGLFMWLPELFNRIQKYGGTPCNLAPMNATHNSTACEDPGNQVYLEGFLTSISNLPGNILTIFLMDKLGRKLLLSTSMVLSGLIVFFISMVRTNVENVVLSCVFGAVSTIGWNALDVLFSELFPTRVRSTASGVVNGVGRLGAILGNVVFGQLVDVSCAVPMILVATLLSFGGLSSLKLPNTVRIDIH
ncbi:synaptic vesicle glycoprotein 2C-like [Gigantopelta aegis]|uniref:synaptic vesicle glycoprotein 2C-like n=1 Tax=Gigantopelta aegis TaxID=1735272 RepID=UPI001B889F94|nr:synaptic vesicle glycoprotein 2C-like [Gigantopelta aegis]